MKRADLYSDDVYPDRDMGGTGYGLGEDVEDQVYPRDHHPQVTDIDTGNPVDFADAGEYSDQGIDPDRQMGGPPHISPPQMGDRKPPLSRTEAGMKTEQVTSKLESLLAKEALAPEMEIEQGTFDTLVSPETGRLAPPDELLTKPSDVTDVEPHPEERVKTAVFEDDWVPQVGDVVKYTPSGRHGKVSGVNGRFAEVDFGDEDVPQTRRVSFNQLIPSEESMEAEEMADTTTMPQGAPQVMIMLQSAAWGKQFEEWCERQPQFELLAVLQKERRGDLEDLEFGLKEAGTTLEVSIMNQGLLGTILNQQYTDGESLLDTLKDRLASKFASTIKMSDGGPGRAAPQRDPSIVPEPVLKQVIREEEKKEERGALSVTEEAEYGAFLEEEKRRLVDVDPQNNIIKTYSRDDEFLDQLGDKFAQEDFPDTLESRIEENSAELMDVYETGMQEGWTTEEMETGFADVLFVSPTWREDWGLTPGELSQEVTQLYAKRASQSQRIGHQKAAASVDLPDDLFSDDDTTQAMRNIGSIAVSHLEESRTRVISGESKLINAAATQFRKDFRKLRGGYTIEEVNPDQIGDDGRIIKGSLIFQVRLAAHTFRRRAAISMVMDVIDGQPQPTYRVITSSGKELPFTKEALDDLMNVRRENMRPSTKITSVPRAFIVE